MHYLIILNPYFIYFITDRETASHPCRHHNQFFEGGDECVEYESYWFHYNCLCNYCFIYIDKTMLSFEKCNKWSAHWTLTMFKDSWY